MFQREEDDYIKSVHGKEEGHYNTFRINDEEKAMEYLRLCFPDGKADELNFVLFSTSGVHGSYLTIEEQWDEREERKKEFMEYEEEFIPDVTFLVIQPRLCTTTHGNVIIKSDEDAKFLKKLRKSSWKAVRKIGAPD